MGVLLHKELGGLHVGKSEFFRSRMTWPFAKIEIYHDKIVINYLFFFNIEIMKHHIDSIEKYVRLNTGVMIKHHNQEKSPFIVFYSLLPDELFKKLKEAGYPVKA